MKQSTFVLFVTGACAIAATCVAWAWGAKQEDVSCAIGGLAGFAVANGIAMTTRRVRASVEPEHASSREFAASESGFGYGVFAIGCFAFVGWLAGYLHEHGDFAGAVCGGLGGFILAVVVPAMHRTSFLAVGRRLQLLLAIVALLAILGIVWAMYKHEFL